MARNPNRDYRTDDVIVSVWLGTFPNAEACGQYFKMEQTNGSDSETCQFWRDVGIKWFDPDNEECSGYVGASVPAEELIDRSWSYFDSFRGPLLDAIRRHAIASANLVIFLYEFEYSAQAGFSSPYMSFVGAFRYVPD